LLKEALMKTAIHICCLFAFLAFAVPGVNAADNDQPQSASAGAVFFPEPGGLMQASWSEPTQDATPPSAAPCHCSHSCGHGLSTRDQLFGDWAGARSGLAEHGIIADLQLTQFYQGVTNGGAEQEFKYGGKLEYFFTFQGGKLGLNEGLNAIMHAETRFGEGIIDQAGTFALPNTAMLYPLPGEDITAITGLLLMQALDERVSLAAGKINVVDLWNMVYPHSGRGVDGFMNLNSLAIGLPFLRFINLSVMGAGILTMQEKQIQGGVLVFDTQNCTTTSGFDNLFGEGAAVLGLWRIFTDWDGKPGNHLFAGSWSSRTYTSLDQNSWTFIPGQGGGLNPGQETGAWALAYYFNQVFWADPCNADRNLRLFSGLGMSDGNPSFARWNGLVSVEGQGLVHCREKDRMGVAYFYTELSNDFRQLVDPLVQLEAVQGVELYYNAELTPWFHLTADLQVIDDENEADDTAIVLGFRGKIDL
jgi:porin